MPMISKSLNVLLKEDNRINRYLREIRESDEQKKMRNDHIRRLFEVKDIIEDEYARSIGYRF